MKLYFRSFVFAVLAAFAAGCNQPKESASTPSTATSAPAPAAAPTPAAAPAPAAPAKEVAVLKTAAGEMVVEFWTDAAPKTIENFKKLAKDGFYDGTAFHRIVKGFMIQGGDPNTKDLAKEGMYGMGGPGYSVNAEFNDHLHAKGVISMARSNDPNSAGSQFFICLGPQPGLDHQYTTFGKLVKGEDVLDKLGDTPVKVGPSGEPSWPLQRVPLESVKIVSSDTIK
jgi:peptidyl-prolyl cis-trans isomerase B (cyclophilin B)